MKSGCSARKRGCPLSQNLVNPLVNSNQQNIGGVIVPGSSTPAKEPSGPQILQKVSLGAPALVVAPPVDLTDQSIGVSVVDTSLIRRSSHNNQTSVSDPQRSNSSAIKPFASPKSSFNTSNTHTYSRHQDISSYQKRMSQEGLEEPVADTAQKNIQFSQSGLLYTLQMIRQPVVEYQESRGVPRNEEITFLTLVTSLCTQAYTAAITILVMLWNLMPLVDGLVYFIRFVLDKSIDIVQTEDNKDRAIKATILFGELTIITFIIFLIVGLIFMPVYVLMARLFSKIFSMIAW